MVADRLYKIYTPVVIHKMNKKLKLWELDRVSEEEFKSQDKLPVTVVLDSIRSLTNVGTFFRTCDAFNVDKIYLCGITAEPPHLSLIHI